MYVCANQGGISSPKVVCSYMQLRFSLICFFGLIFWFRVRTTTCSWCCRPTPTKPSQNLGCRCAPGLGNSFQHSFSLCLSLPLGHKLRTHTHWFSVSLSFLKNTSSLSHPHSLSLSHSVSPSLPLLPPFAHLFVHVMASGVVHLVPLVHVDDPSPRR